MAKRERVLFACRSIFLYLMCLAFSYSATLAETPTPEASGFRTSGQVSGYQGAFSDLAAEIDRFWVQVFRDTGQPYSQPDIVIVDRRIYSACGPIEPTPNAFYCPGDRTIYLVPQFLVDQEARFGDYAPVTVLGHEWGHHVQELLGVRKVKPIPFELQADCLTGVFARHAQGSNLLDADDIAEAVDTSIEAGDPVFVHEDDPRAHGSRSERVVAFMEGFYEGPVDGCTLPLSQSRSTTDQTIDRSAEGDGGGLGSAGPPTPTGSPRLPASLPLAHASCFGIVDDGAMTFDQLVGRFNGFPDASARLQGWGWQASAFRQFGCDGPPEGDAGWIDINVHGFANAASAQAAADYFVAVRMDGTALSRADGPDVGDYSIALVGPATNGKEFTIYATRGPWLVRVTGVSPSGIPFMNVRTVAVDVLAAQDVGGTTSGNPPPSEQPTHVPTTSSADYLPSVPNVPHADCFRTQNSGPNRYQDVVAAFARTGAGPEAIEVYGWQDGAWIVFTCGDPPPGRAKQIDVSIHQFRDATAARQVASTVESFQNPGAHESRDCSVARALVICVTGYADSGTPAADVRFVLNQVVASAR